MSHHHNLLKENYGKPKKQDKASLRKQISSPGVGYVLAPPQRPS